MFERTRGDDGSFISGKTIFLNMAKNGQMQNLWICVCFVVLRHGQAFSPIYRFSLSDGTIVSAHTKSKLVRSSGTNEPQFYMSLHILQRYQLPHRTTYSRLLYLILVLTQMFISVGVCELPG